ncbi:MULTISPECIES: TetR family transcriptional regulator [unclassified Microbacterium]|uniref:TetR family transcriptional regulator n=1 Tax=unclassified Microbacterium TaxID=2609290 RepID=UPI001656E3A9|nr:MULTISPECIES: TetR family transcriptional regulator [unclassified Microbacterium]MCT1363881.1 TetR family transcriptional regulator [Microbacterium sp. p3-SID131]MCT1375638.1 TetR family transcriptional regulator [Microbacterium sp. p3-SID337]MDH5132280.1 TetR family transcriptional regulator [Microbacterium sp. RD10]MDH5135421.1 TetR family transcriptional regulator [Microbacterium sp. RD11]MDH5143673.1 TetR family transcriptional regulator [Microbacterium sp. RD12]
MSPDTNPARHDRDSVSRTALSLLDEVGLADLSMRRIAARLDVQPSALYWHVANKQELLADLADRITAGVPAGDGGVLTTARALRDALFAYRDGAELVLSTYALQLGSAHAREALVAALRAEGAQDAEDRGAAILHFVLGHATLVQQRMHADSHGALPSSSEVDVTAGLDRVFDLGVIALAGELSAPKTPRRARA